eukprot:COSAG04_NODE_32171_length_252_cov_1.019608_2_plen_27_part_01
MSILHRVSQLKVRSMLWLETHRTSAAC